MVHADVADDDATKTRDGYTGDKWTRCVGSIKALNRLT